MDKGLIRRRFSRATATYADRADVQREIARKMIRLIDRYVPRDAHRGVLEVGCGTGLFTRMYLRHFRPDSLLLNDICPEMKVQLADVLGRQVRFCAGDAETFAFPSGQKLITSCSAIQWFDSPAAFFRRCSSLLTEEGYLSFSTFGKQNLYEVASLTGKTLPYLSLDELKELLSVRYQLVYAAEEQVRMVFPSAWDVLKHLQATGVTGISRQQWTRRDLSDFCAHYEARFPDKSGGVSLTYHPIYVIVKKKAS